MTDRVTRRTFLAEGGRASLGLSLLSIVGCSGQEQTAPIGKGTSALAANWAPLIADLEQRLPTLLAQATTVPGVSMALVADGKLLWRGAFGVKDFASKAPVEHTRFLRLGR
jgi:CubicO group peptidase (beta-lactamase class C family)